MYVALVTDHSCGAAPISANFRGNNDIQFTRLRSSRERASSAWATSPRAARRAAERAAGEAADRAPPQLLHPDRRQDLQDLPRRYASPHRNLAATAPATARCGTPIATRWMRRTWISWWSPIISRAIRSTPGGASKRLRTCSTCPAIFTAIYGTERSVNYPNGHRNLVFAKRGVPILAISREERAGKANSGPVLYPFLREEQRHRHVAQPAHRHGDGLARQRSRRWSRSWRCGRARARRPSTKARRSRRRPKKTELWAGGYRPLGFVWNAWAKGYKLGVQASSDHVSTHISYTCVIWRKAPAAKR